MDEFGRLEPVDLRTAWKHEALNFGHVPSSGVRVRHRVAVA